VVKPSFDKMKKHIGTSPSEEEEGQHVEAADGRVLELICANFLADPNYDTPETTPETSTPTTVEQYVSDEEVNPDASTTTE
jgi:hypothetical protein